MLLSKIEEIKALKDQFNLFPIVDKSPLFFDTSLSIFLKTSSNFLLESVENNSLGRYSIVGRGKKRHFVLNDNEIFDYEEDRLQTQTSLENPLDYVQRELLKYRVYSHESFPPFTGGLLGYLGYECAYYFEDISNVPLSDDLSIASSILAMPKELFIVDHVKHELYIVVFVDVRKKDALKNLTSLFENAVERIEEIKKLLSRPSQRKQTSSPQSFDVKPLLKDDDRDDFISNVKKIKEKIIDGDCIQVVYSRKEKYQISPQKEIFLYLELRRASPSPYMYFLDFDSFFIIGSSPEMMVKLQDEHIALKPISATVRRDNSPKEEETLQTKLLNDEKEKAKHLALVDLGRSDLYRVCDEKTLRVARYMQVESFSLVNRFVSTIEAKIGAEKNAFDLVKAVFPSGSLSGVPKAAAMKIIRGFEEQKRNAYGGCVLILGWGGKYLDSCAVVQTFVVKDGIAHLQAGVGVVYDSIPEKDYEETEIKLSSLKEVLENLQKGVDYDLSY